MTNFELVSRKSMQNLMSPVFFVTRTMREPHDEFDFLIMLRDSMSSICLSTMAWPSGPSRDGADWGASAEAVQLMCTLEIARLPDLSSLFDAPPSALSTFAALIRSEASVGGD